MMKFRSGLAALAVSVAFAGAALAEDQVIRFATWSQDNLAIQEAIARKFEEANPGVKVQVESYGDGYDTKLAAAMGAGDAPDVMYMWNFPAYAVSLLPLNDLIARDAEAMNYADIPEGLMSTATIDGNILGMPAGYTTHVVFYNKDMLAAAGVAEPAAGWTWDDLRKAAAAISKPEENIFGFAVDAKPDPYDFEQFFWSNGTQYISDDGKAVEGYMNSPEAVEVLTMFADMVKSGEAVALNIGDQTSGGDLFKAGKLAMFESGQWSLPGIQESGVNFGVAVLPAFGAKPVKSAINASSLSISKDSKNVDLAWEFVKFFASPEAIKMRTYELPPRTSVAEEAGLTQDPTLAPFVEMLAVSGGTTPAFLKNAEWARIQENLSAAIEATMVEQGNAQANLDEAVQRSARFLK
jgi:multiple sugar transport system substrate-binding protein